MSAFDLWLDGKRYSYSSVSSYTTCPYSFKLSYINEVPRENNFYAQYGSFVHLCFEEFFKGELEEFQLSGFYADNYKKHVSIPAPFGADAKYYTQGQDFFDHFSFKKEDYDVLLIEGKIDFELNGLDIVAKPDLVLFHKNLKKFILIDYKTSTPYRIDNRSGKEVKDAKKLLGYKKQMYLYAYALRNHKLIPIDEIQIWYPRLRKRVATQWDWKEEEKIMAEFENVINDIKADEVFSPNNKEAFFCNNICSVRAQCEFH